MSAVQERVVSQDELWNANYRTVHPVAICGAPMNDATQTTDGLAYFVYLLRCDDDSLYTGIAADVFDRAEKHNAGKGAKYTRSRRPIRLAYCERHVSKSEALKREAQIKKWSRGRKESLIHNQAR